MHLACALQDGRKDANIHWELFRGYKNDLSVGNYKRGRSTITAGQYGSGRSSGLTQHSRSNLLGGNLVDQI
jgi:hypothetical protein